MNCKEASDLFGDALDGKDSLNIRSSFFEHLGACPPCRKAFELEKVTKDIVRNTCKKVSTPPQVLNAVISELQRQSQRPPSVFEWIQEVFTPRRLIPALAASVAIATFLIFFDSQTVVDESDVHAAENDIIVQSLQNFAKLQTGELKPARISKVAEEVHTYLDSSGIHFAIVRTMDCCRTYGAITSEFGGIRLAHVVYTMDDDVLYVYQVRKKHVMEGSILVIPVAARTALQKTGWYTDSHHPDYNVVLWIVDETLCAAVSSMKKDEMLALLNGN
jgi:anti-sigma factor RsiW